MAKQMKFFSAVFVVMLSPSLFAKQYILNKFKIEVHPPKGYQVKPRADTLLINFKLKGQVRYDESVTISIFNGPLPQGLAEKRIGSRSVFYSWTSLEGGSGGSEFTTTAFENGVDKFIRYEHHSQNENSEPNLTILWETIEKTKIIK